MAPLAGYRLGTDLRLRAELDHWPDSKLQEALNHRNSEWHAFQTRLKEEGFGVDNSSEQPHAVQVALNGFLAKLPSCMVAASLDDLAGEIEAVNVPGFGQDKHRSWSRRMTMPLESIIESETIKQSLASWAMP
jgi:glycogen operon protein